MDNLESITRNYFLDSHQVLTVRLFGSYAKGTNGPLSDIDIAIFCDPKHKLSAFDVMGMRQDLSDLLKKEVDLVCLNEASPILGMQVASSGKDILQKNKKLYDVYLMHRFSSYAELKELRAPMEKEIFKRKFYD